jgi:hypothetical protein
VYDAQYAARSALGETYAFTHSLTFWVPAISERPHFQEAPMVRFFAILLLLVSPAFAADSPVQSGKDASGPESLRLTGPVEASAGAPVSIVVHGLPSVDLEQAVGEQTRWIETIRFAISGPDDAELELDKELSMTVAPWGWRLRVTFVPPEDGVYVLVCDWNQSPYGLALHRVQIGPRPPPDPPQPPTPTPGTIERVVIVEESGDRTPEIAAILTDPRLKPLRDARKLLILDQDAADSSGTPASELSQHDGQPLPRVIGLDSSGVRSAAAELPGSADGLIELLKTWGVL